MREEEMEKTRWRCGLATICCGIRTKGKTRSRVWLIQPFVCVLVLGGVSTSLAATTCGAPDSCVVTIYLYYAFSYTSTASNTSFSFLNVDNTCNHISPVQKKPPVIGPTIAYEGNLYKFYFIGTGWGTNSAGGLRHIEGQDGLSLISSVTYSVSFTSFLSMYLANPFDYLPENCSLLPSLFSQTANPDPGKPDCPQVPLN